MGEQRHIDRAAGVMTARVGDALSLARRSALIAVGGTALLVEAGGRLLRRAQMTGTKQVTAWRASVGRARSRLFGRSEPDA